jgi:chemotaxis protein CheY-P-specific phosphatase CheC/ActR/RegA family two-component response regulator
MKAQERFDKILIAGSSRIQDEVTALIGKPFRLGTPQTGPIDKQNLFGDLGGKQILAHVRLDGDIQGAGCLILGIKDAIQIGGTLIMLPESELESVVADQQYSEELQDSYGEVANIICGAATVTFEEQYTKVVRLIRTEQEIILPAKVDIESEQPIADVPYYRLSVPMEIDGKALGELHLLLPAEPFGLVEAKVKEAPSATTVESATKSPSQADEPDQETVGVLERESAGAPVEEVGVVQRPESDAASEVTPSGQATPKKRDIGKQKKLIDGLLINSWAKMSDEVSALLGGTLKVVPLENQAITKEDFLDQAGGKQVMTRMDLRGESGGEAYLFVDLKTAVYLGGCLIMLPEGELEETVRNESFGDDARDAFGEVTNIISGVFTAIFEEQYRGKIGFVKAAIDPMVPAKIDPDTDDVFPSLGYYLALGQVQYNGRDLGRAQFLVPAQVFELEDLFLATEEIAATPTQAAPVSSSSQTKAAEPARLRESAESGTDMLIVTDDESEAERLVQVLEGEGYLCRIMHFKDPVHAVLSARTQMVFLVMQEVSEQGFGVAIKISSSGYAVPLVAAGPAWTRTMVLKAVKYGACDILITPASIGDVREKLATNLVKKAA